MVHMLPRWLLDPKCCRPARGERLQAQAAVQAGGRQRTHTCAAAACYLGKPKEIPTGGGRFAAESRCMAVWRAENNVHAIVQAWLAQLPPNAAALPRRAASSSIAAVPTFSRSWSTRPDQ